MRRCIAAFAAVAVLMPAAAVAKTKHHVTPVEAPANPPVTRIAEMVQLTPAPGVAIQIPKDWIACDADTAKLLNPERDPLRLKTLVCGMSPSVPFKLRAYDPKPFHNLAMTFNWHEKTDLTPEAVAAMTPDVLESAKSVICGVATKPASADGIVVVSCNVSVVAFANHEALMSTIVESSPKSAVSDVLITSWELPFAGGYMQLQFSRAQLVQSIVQPEMNAIVASLQVQ